MSWELILQIAALVLLGAIAAMIGGAIWTSVSETKHKRTLELIDRRNAMPGQMRDIQWREHLGRAPEDG